MNLSTNLDVTTIKPLVMLVEDNVKKIKHTTRAFNDRGCDVIAFTHSDEAMKSIFSSPSLDLIERIPRSLLRGQGVGFWSIMYECPVSTLRKGIISLCCSTT